MSWNYEKIAVTERGHAEARLGDADRETLMAEIVALRSVLHPLLVTLSSLDDKAPRGVHATSQLFPALIGEGEDEDKLAVYDPETRGFRYVAPVGRDLHRHEYELADSIMLDNGADGSGRLDGAVSVFAVHGQWIGAYAFCGEITMADIRRGAAVMWPPAEAAATIERAGEE